MDSDPRCVHDAVSEAALRQSCLWGLAGVIGAEQPQLWGGLVDIADTDALAACAAPLAAVLPTPAKSTLLLRSGDFLTATLAPISGQPVREGLRCRPDAAYLVTGGLGELGLLMADWLVDRGAPSGPGRPLGATAATAVGRRSPLTPRPAAE